MDMLSENFGFDFRVQIVKNNKAQYIRVEDSFGTFAPMGFRAWQSLIDKMYVPAILLEMRLRKIVPVYRIAYQEAIYRYCRDYQHMYICFN